MSEQQYGEFDGEPIASLALRVTGQGSLDRVLKEGERVILTCEGTVGLPSLKRVDGRLVRVHPIAVSKVAEPFDQLADEVERFIEEVEDRRQGRAQLPFDDPDPDAPEDTPPL